MAPRRRPDDHGEHTERIVNARQAGHDNAGHHLEVDSVIEGPPHGVVGDQSTHGLTVFRQKHDADETRVGGVVGQSRRSVARFSVDVVAGPLRAGDDVPSEHDVGRVDQLEAGVPFESQLLPTVEGARELDECDEVTLYAVTHVLDDDS